VVVLRRASSVQVLAQELFSACDFFIVRQIVAGWALALGAALSFFQDYAFNF